MKSSDILVYKMAESFFIFQRAASPLASYLERAFNRNLADLRKLQKERRLEDIGFVPQPDPEDAAHHAFAPRLQEIPLPDLKIVSPPLPKAA